MSTTCVTIFFLLLTMATFSTISLEHDGLETIQMAQTQILQVRKWVQSMGGGLSQDLNPAGVAFSDCVKLYSESEFRLAQLLLNENLSDEDTCMWLSGVLANHKTCLNGLNEKGFNEIQGATQNLTFWLNKALALQRQGKGIWRGAPRRPIYNHGGGILTSWSPATSKADFIVAMDGSGVYNEKVEIEYPVKNVMLVGDGIDRTIITGSRNVPDGDTTLSSASFGVSGDGFWARDITFENTAGPYKYQAVALRASSDFSVFYRCSFKGYQDTLFVLSLRQFYRDCHIYGTIDFIFGNAAAVFQNCDIFVRRPMHGQGNYITAQSRDDPNENTGISIHRSRVRPAPDFAAVKNSYRTYLGRPWKEYSRTVFMKTDLDGLIDPVGWGEWHGYKKLVPFVRACLYIESRGSQLRVCHFGLGFKWCPKCMELKLPREGAAFCTQDCFKASWSSHKSVHLKAKLFSFGTGSPGEQDLGGLNEGWLYCLQRGQTPTPKLPLFDWTGTLRPYLISPMRVVPAHIDQPDWAVDIKSPDQIQRMRETCRIAREVLDAASQVRRPGVTTDEIDRVVHEATIAAGIKDGDIVNVDVTEYYKGVDGDLNETYRVGNVDEASFQLVQCTFECLEKAISIGVWRDQMWPDGWTAVPADGKRSAQFEHALLVTETGVEVLPARLLASPRVFPWLPSSPSVFHG
ncbi:hypothetical protein GH714_018695 [Hevea brasiliensis]|uniref:Pectinesterase n=1 Tax=Hevea brasiliensis TaxID=3981 RepID=A0A6A6LTM3_HEVBR|nr:hypothetical protein GH714_018695 [Hevea brasiliensis]